MGLLQNQTGIQLQKVSAQEEAAEGKLKWKNADPSGYEVRGRWTAALTHTTHQPAPPLICRGKAVFGRQKNWLEERNTPKNPHWKKQLEGKIAFFKCDVKN